MSSLVFKFNALVASLFNTLLWPFSGLAPLWGLLFISVLSGVIFLKIYGWTSNQQAIRATKSRIYGLLLETVLYRHDVRSSLSAQGGMLWQACRYFGLAVPPIMVLCVPCLVILAHLNVRYGYRPLHKGERAVVSVRLGNPDLLYRLRIEPVRDMVVSPPVRVPATSQVFWGVQSLGGMTGATDLKIISEEGNSNIGVAAGQEVRSYSALIALGGASALIEPSAIRSWWQELLFPVRAPLWKASLPIQEFSVTYPEARYDFLGIRMHWLVVFFVVSLISGIAASRFLGVEI